MGARPKVGPAGGHISVGAVPRSYQVTPVGPSHLVPAECSKASPARTATHVLSQTPDEKNPTTATAATPTMTLSVFAHDTPRFSVQPRTLAEGS
jgi:hypothetical protein